MRRTVTAVILGLGVLAPAVRAEPLTFVSQAAQVRLIELYTSEGCSSCPPADRWLGALKGDSRLWREMIPVAFHVDYWDYIGWKDRFASAAYSRRQRDYARVGGLSQVYTPGLLIEGREWQGWFRDPVLKLGPAPEVGPMELDVTDGGRAAIRFRPGPDAAAAELKASVVLLGFDLTSDVRAGENSGRRLHHDFVVLGLTEVPLQRHGDTYSGEATLPAPAAPAHRLAVAAWISAGSDPTPRQAVGGWLSP